jgi:hypothetical protein
LTYINQTLIKKSSLNLNNNSKINLKGGVNLPQSVDWRTKGVVNAIKYQGLCASCWAFSSLGVIESMAAIISGQLPPPLLSEQNLVDCVYNNYDGCQGGFIEDVMIYIKNNGGIDTSTAYPYNSGQTGTLNNIINVI